MTVIDDDNSPPEPCAREDCCRPFSCVCPEGDLCHLDRLDAIAPKVRPELEMPDRG